MKTMTTATIDEVRRLWKHNWIWIRKVIRKQKMGQVVRLVERDRYIHTSA